MASQRGLFRLMAMAITLVLLATSCGGGDEINSSASCSELELAWVYALADPEATGEDLNEVNSQAIDRALELQQEAEERDNQLQYEMCSNLVVQMAIVGGYMDPTFESCDDGSLAPIGECP